MIDCQLLLDKAKWLGAYSEQNKINYKEGGMSIEEMDCQGLCEFLLIECGLSKAEVNLKGSNAHFRKSLKWEGTIEGAMHLFGEIPKAAWLFIHEPDTRPKGYNDNLGDANHMGQYTENMRCVHASQSKGQVVHSEVNLRNASRGGWNHVGLPKWVRYSDEVEAVLALIIADYKPAVPEMSEADYLQAPGYIPDVADTPAAPAVPPVTEPGLGQAKINTEKDPLILRKEPKDKAEGIKEMPKGHIVSVIGTYGEWTQVDFVDFRGMRHRGWCKTKYLWLG